MHQREAPDNFLLSPHVLLPHKMEKRRKDRTKDEEKQRQAQKEFKEIKKK